MGRSLGAASIVALLAVGGWALASGRLSLTDRVGPAAATSGDSIGPTPGREAAPAPLGTPPAVADSAAYRFIAMQSDGVTPVAYDPCRPIHYVMRAQHAPAGAAALVRAAFTRVSDATGLQFVSDGSTDEAPSRTRERYQPDRYGDRWAPVLVAWSTPAEQPDFSGGVVGQAGSQAMPTAGSPDVFVTGQVELDSTWFTTQLRQDRRSKRPSTVLLHELGHLVGLDHVSDPRQVMYAEGQPAVTDYADGDLAGLARLGSGTCVPDL